jgi:uncharacterized protein involved in exopolysaccharide biosynthesis
MSSESRHSHTGADDSISAKQPIYLAVTPPTDDGIDLLRLWRVLEEGKWLLVASVLLSVCIGIAYSLLATHRYRAEALLAPAGATQPAGAMAGLGGLASLAGIKVGGADSGAETVAMLQSKKFIEDFIRDKNLLPVLFADRWDAAAGKWQSADPAEQPDLRDGIDYFLDGVLELSKDGETGFVTLALEWRDPQQAAQWVMELVARANETKRRNDIRDAQQKLDYLNEQLAQANLIELRQAISRVVEEQVSAMTMAQAQAEYAFKVIDPAMVPKERVWPQRTLIVIAAALFGGMLGIFIILVRAVNRKLASSRAQR